MAAAATVATVDGRAAAAVATLDGVATADLAAATAREVAGVWTLELFSGAAVAEEIGTRSGDCETKAPTPRIIAATSTALIGSNLDTLRSGGFSSVSVISNHSGLLFSVMALPFLLHLRSPLRAR